MSQDPRHDAPGVDRLELHHCQQLSALVDGELAPDEARFLWRRLEHDRDLAGRYERWQLCGQLLRREPVLVAAPDFSERVAAALRQEAAHALAAPAAAHAGRRGAWTRWGGGAAALAASVAAVALLVNRPQVPEAGYGPTAPALVAEGAQQAPAAAAVIADATQAGPAVARAVAPAPQAEAAAPRASRPQALVREPLRAVAAVRPATETRRIPGTAVPAQPDRGAAAATALAAADPVTTNPAAATASDPFASAAPLHARPWPRAALPQVQAAGGYTASFGQSGQARTFYPFEPRLLAPEAAADAAEPAPADDDATEPPR